MRSAGLRPFARRSSPSTVTSRRFGRRPGAAPRPRPPPPPATQRFCSSIGSATRVASPARSPVGRMAGRALRLEVRLAGRGVADDDVEHDGRPGGRRALPARRRLHAVHVGGDRLDVGFGQSRQRRHHRHAGVLPAAERMTGPIELAVLVVQRELRAEQVGPAHVAAAQVHAVTGAAVDAVERLAARDERGVAGRRCCAGNVPGPRPRPWAAPAPAAPAPWPAGGGVWVGAGGGAWGGGACCAPSRTAKLASSTRPPASRLNFARITSPLNGTGWTRLRQMISRFGNEDDCGPAIDERRAGRETRPALTSEVVATNSIFVATTSEVFPRTGIRTGIGRRAAPAAPCRDRRSG